MAEPTPTPLDAERARLRAKGLTEAEISQIFINRESGSGSQQPAGAAPVQGTMTGVLGNASAVLSHARGTIPAIKADLANLFNSRASPTSRTRSAGALALVAVIVAVLGFAIYQEWQQHIVSATQRAAADALRAQVEAEALAHRPCLVQGVNGCLKYGLNAAEADAAAKSGSLPASVFGAPAPIDEAEQKEIARLNKKMGRTQCKDGKWMESCPDGATEAKP